MLVALDLDYTLVAPKEGRRWNVIMADLFETFGVPQAATLAAYVLAENKMQISVPAIGSTLNQQGFNIDLEAAQKRLYESMSELMEVYVEISETMAALRSAGLPIAIVTAGDEYQQKKKAEAMNITYDDFHAVPTPEAKAGALRQLLEKHDRPIIFADDLPHALDAVYAAGLNDRVTTLRVRRGPHTEMEPLYPHEEIADLSGVLDTLTKKGIHLNYGP